MAPSLGQEKLGQEADRGLLAPGKLPDKVNTPCTMSSCPPGINIYVLSPVFGSTKPFLRLNIDLWIQNTGLILQVM